MIVSGGTSSAAPGFDVLQAFSFACLTEGYNTIGLNMVTPLTTLVPPVAPFDYCHVKFNGPPPTPSIIGPTRAQADYNQTIISDTTDGDLDPAYGDTSAVFHEGRFLIEGNTTPEPLTSVLQSVNTAMNTYAKTGFSSDRIGVIGFDDDILPIRSTIASDPALPASLQNKPGLVRTTDPEYLAMMAATDLTANPSAHLPKMLFPRIFSGQSKRNIDSSWTPTPGLFPQPYAQTDLFQFVERSLNIFKNTPGGDEAQSMLILFTDGLATCPDPRLTGVTDSQGRPLGPGDRRSSFNTYLPWPPLGSGVPFSGLPGNGQKCSGTSWEHNVMAIEDVVEAAKYEYAEAQVSMNIFLFGESVAPHTNVRGGEKRRV